MKEIKGEVFDINFIQELTAEDIVKLNLFILSINRKFKYNLGVAAVASVICFFYKQLNHHILFGIVFAVISLIVLFVIPNLLKLIIANSIRKKMKSTETWPVEININRESFYYHFTSENIEKIDPYVMGQIRYVKETNDYYYIVIESNLVLVIKKRSVESDQLVQIDEIFREVLKENIRFFSKK